MLQEQKLEELEKVVGKGGRKEEPQGLDVTEEERSGNYLHNKLTFQLQLGLTQILMSPLFSLLTIK